MEKWIGFFLVIFLTGCSSITPRPHCIDNINAVFKENPKWYVAAKTSEEKWGVPIPVQMAILYQESRFEAKAKPPRDRLLWIVPWKRKSSAYGYTQALDETWRSYQNSTGNFVSRTDFAAATDFIGWYGNYAHLRLGIPCDDAYELYLAYHEGYGGFERSTYLKKAWLIQVAKNVQNHALVFQKQLANYEEIIP